MLIVASYALYFMFSLVLVSLARAFAHAQLHPFAYVAVVWPLCFGMTLLNTYTPAITVGSPPGARMLL